MNKIFILTAGALIGVAACAAPALAGVDVSISLGQPNFYGVIDMGGAPPPRIIYSQPRVVEHVVVQQEPIYLHVRPGQSRHWDRYCGEYDACGRRVYFVTNNGKMMVADVTRKDRTIAVSEPRELFQFSFSFTFADYDLGPDGRFLVTAPVERSEWAPSAVIVNWQQALTEHP